MVGARTILVAACATKPPARPASGPALVPDGPPPDRQTNGENAEPLSNVEEKRQKTHAIPDEPLDDPAAPDDGPKPTAHAKIDALLAAVEKADTIEIMDEWNGLGATYGNFVRLDRTGDELSYRAKIGEFGSVGERVADPTEPRGEQSRRCLCPIEKHCKCERDYVRKSGKIPFATIQAFLRRLSRKRVDRNQKHPTGAEHTDDYPRVHLVLTGPTLGAPLHLSVRDNRRHWRANGLFITPDPPPAPQESVAIIIGPVGTPSRQEKLTIVRTDKHERLNGSFQRMLALLGAREWQEESTGRGGSVQ